MLASCNDDEMLGSNLDGTWNLVNVTCECFPANLVEGEHLWTFNTKYQQVTVENLVEKDLQILASGTYSIVLTEAKVEIVGERTFDYRFEDETLFLSDLPESDGPLMEFVR